MALLFIPVLAVLWVSHVFMYRKGWRDSKSHTYFEKEYPMYSPPTYTDKKRP